MIESKISIITVSYNAVKTIEQTILSVINQTYNNIEYIIIDGGSTDGTVDIIKKYEDKIAYWISESDNGIYDAMNKGTNHATGDYVQFLGADDCLVSTEIIYSISKYLNGNIDILSAPVWLIDDEYAIQHVYQNNFSVKEILMGKMPPHQGVFSKIELLKEHPFNLKYKIDSDFEFIFYCALKNKKFKFIDKKIVYFSNAGTSRNDNILKILKGKSPYDVDRKERKNIAKQYQICEENLDLFLGGKRHGRLNRCLKWIIIETCRFINVYQLLWVNVRKWELHSCSLESCRWCKILK